MNFRDLVEIVVQELEKVFSRVKEENIQKFVEIIVKANRIFIVGVGREGLSSRAFAMRLMHLGKVVYWIWDDTTPSIGKGDLLIATVGGGYIPTVHHVVVESKNAGAMVAVVTAVPDGETSKMADAILDIPACVYRGRGDLVLSVQPMGSLFEQAIYIIFDIVVLLLANVMKITPAEMETRHRNVE